MSASDVVDCVERECPRCRALVFFATTDDPSTECTACSMRPKLARRPRVAPIIDAPPEEDLVATAVAERRRLVNIIGVACGVGCVIAFALGGVAMGAVTILGSAGALAIANRRQRTLVEP